MDGCHAEFAELSDKFVFLWSTLIVNKIINKLSYNRS